MKAIIVYNQKENDEKNFFSMCLNDYLIRVTSQKSMCDAMVEKWFENE
jgi:hypothetical protein